MILDKCVLEYLDDEILNGVIDLNEFQNHLPENGGWLDQLEFNIDFMRLVKRYKTWLESNT